MNLKKSSQSIVSVSNSSHNPDIDLKLYYVNSFLSKHSSFLDVQEFDSLDDAKVYFMFMSALCCCDDDYVTLTDSDGLTIDSF